MYGDDNSSFALGHTVGVWSNGSPTPSARASARRRARQAANPPDGFTDRRVAVLPGHALANPGEARTFLNALAGINPGAHHAAYDEVTGLPTTINADPEAGSAPYMKARYDMQSAALEPLRTAAADAFGPQPDGTGDSAAPPDFGSDAPPPPNPLRREIPRAPTPVDLAGIDRDERAKLEAERGPRIKENPHGVKGFLLGLAKGAVGLAEGAAHSGASTFMDALPFMAQGATNRIDAYRTNREDYEPFDADLKQRVADRIRPLAEQYAQDHQRYDDDLKRFGIQTDQDRFDAEEADKARGYAVQEGTLGLGRDTLKANVANQLRTDAREREQIRLEHEARMTTALNSFNLGVARLKDSVARGRLQGQMKAFETRASTLADQERHAEDLLREFDGKRYDGITPSQKADLESRYGAAATQLQSIRDQREALVRQMESLANQYNPDTSLYFQTGSTAGADASRAAETSRILDDKAHGRISEEEAGRQLEALGYKRRGAR